MDSLNSRPFRIRLLWTVLQLQQANHSGDPAAVRNAVNDYLKIRDEVFRKSPSLVAHVDCNLSVHFCDRFDFSEAETVLSRVWKDAAFSGFDFLQKAVVESSLGQVLAMQGVDGGAFFEDALVLLEQADLSDERRRLETAQTRACQALSMLSIRTTTTLLN